jgi:hypothetical protein
LPEIGGITEEALLLFGRATASMPDAAVTLGLRWTGSPGRYSHFDRLDWRRVPRLHDRLFAVSPPGANMLAMFV